MPFCRVQPSRCLLALAIGFTTSSLIAADTSLEFLKALQKQGYGELAVEHLEQLKASGKLPEDLADTWDLEMSTSLRLAAKEAYNRQEEAQRSAKAQEHLNKFLKDHPNHPAAGEGELQAGAAPYESALEKIRQAQSEKDDAAKAKLQADARAALESAQPHFEKAVSLFENAKNATQKIADEDAERRRGAPSARGRKLQQAADEAFGAWIEARMKRISIGFYLAQTYSDKEKAKRTELLAKAGKEFDSIYQDYRGDGMLVAFYAHLWQGRCEEEAGNIDVARDIYDEVLAIAPDDSRQAATGLEPLFAQVNYSVLMLVKKKEGAAAFTKAADEFLKSNSSWTKLDGYQAVALEQARALLEQAEKAAADQKPITTKRAKDILRVASRTRTSHQAEAILLMRQVTGKDEDAKATTADEAIARASEAAVADEWSEAVKLLEEAVGLATKVGQKATITRATELLDKAQYRLAHDHLQKGRLEDVIALAGAMAKDRPTSENTAKASALAASAALSLYAAADDSAKPVALDRLNKIAEFIVKQWPDQAEADDARMALGQANLVRGEWAEAIAVFEKVNERSLRYPTSLFLAGQTHFRLYTLAKKQPEASRDADRMKQELATATGQLTKSVELQRKALEPGAKSSPGLADAQLLLAEVELEAGNAKQALLNVAPLIADLKSTRPKTIDNSVLRTCFVGVRANLAEQNAAAAGEVALLLAELAPDHPLNITMAKIISQAYKQAQAGPSGAFADALKKELGKVLALLAKREQLALGDMIFIADSSAELGNLDAAEALYAKILAQADSGVKLDPRAVTRIRAKQVDLKVAKNDFENGLPEVNKLIADNPNALEPLMSKGKLLQGLAESEPSEKNYDAAIKQWTLIFNRLLKTRPAEFYEAAYNMTWCMHKGSEHLADKSQAKKQVDDAAQVLSALLAQSPKLNGPETVARYRQLLDQIKAGDIAKPTDQAAKR